MPREAPIRVVVADDHEPSRALVRIALAGEPGFEVAGEAADAAGAVETALRLRPDVCLLDVNMPGGGIRAAWEIHSRLPRTKVVMLTGSQEDPHLLGALRAGADGYLLKGMDPARLPRTLEAVVRGEIALPRALVPRIVNELRDRSPRRRALAGEADGERLTSREWQVLELLQERQSVAQIAKRLVLSPVTVRTHIGAIQRKFDVSSREALLERLDSDATSG